MGSRWCGALRGGGWNNSESGRWTVWLANAPSDANGNVATATFTVTVQYAFGGFSGRVSGPPAVNYLTAGNTVPISFSLGGDRGADIFAAGSPSSRQVNCITGAPLGAGTPTGGSLSFFGGQYTYYWATDPAWGGTCRTFSLGLKDGSVRTLNFGFYVTPGSAPPAAKIGRARAAGSVIPD